MTSTSMTTLLFIHTNDTHPNFRLCTASMAAPGDWAERIAPSPAFYMTGVSIFADQFVVEGREDGLDQIEVHSYDPAVPPRRIAFPEASYVAGVGDNPEYAIAKLRLGYESMVTPGTVYDYDLSDGSLEVLKVQTIPSGYDPATICDRTGPDRRARRNRGALFDRLSGRLSARWDGQALPLFLWCLRPCHPAGLLDRADVVPRPRHGVCHRAYPRRRRSGPAMVSGRQAGQAGEHLQRLRRCGEGADRSRLHPARAASRSPADRRAAS